MNRSGKLFLMRICLLTSSYPRFKGDISGNFILELCKELSGRGIKFEVVAPGSFPPARGNRVDQRLPDTPGIKVNHFTYFIPRGWQRLAYGAGIEENLRRNPVLYLLLPFFLTSFFIKAWRASRHCDLIWSHWLLPAGIVGELVGRMMGKPHCITIHSAVPRRIARSLRPLFRNLVCVIAVNRELRRSIGGLVGRERRLIHTIPMGVRTFARASPGARAVLRKKYGVGDRFIILSMGRLVKIKGFHTLIRAVRQIPGTLLVVAGEGPCRDELRELAVGCSSYVRFERFISGAKKLDWLTLCDIFVLPSITLKGGRSEGMPVSLMEALAAGKPVIASDTGGIGDVITDGYNGILVSPGNATALEESIRSLLDNPELRERLAANALRSASLYRIESVSDKYEDIFAECVKNREGPRGPTSKT